MAGSGPAIGCSRGGRNIKLHAVTDSPTTEAARSPSS